MNKGAPSGKTNWSSWF